MRHFVRFAKLSATGAIERGGWRLRIFQTPGEAGAFTAELSGESWRVETGHYDDAPPAAEMIRRRRAEAFAAERVRATFVRPSNG